MGQSHGSTGQVQCGGAFQGQQVPLKVTGLTLQGGPTSNCELLALGWKAAPACPAGFLHLPCLPHTRRAESWKKLVLWATAYLPPPSSLQRLLSRFQEWRENCGALSQAGM